METRIRVFGTVKLVNICNEELICRSHATQEGRYKRRTLPTLFCVRCALLASRFVQGPEIFSTALETTSLIHPSIIRKEDLLFSNTDDELTQMPVRRKSSYRYAEDRAIIEIYL